MWAQTAGALMRGQATSPRALASIPGPDSGPRASQFPDAAAEYRVAWASDRWAFQARGEDGSITQFADNAGVRAEMRRLAEEGPPVGWLDFPGLGFPPAELRPLYSAAIARSTRIGTASPAGTDETWQQMNSEHEAALRQWDYDRTAWARTG